MSVQIAKTQNIYGGIAPAYYFSGKGQYLSGIAIDPDVPRSDASTDIKTSGSIRPVAYETFSSTPVNSTPIAVITNPKDTKVYTVLKNGKLISYDSSLGTETTVGTVAGSNAEGATYYNNYIYIFGTGAGKDDVSRYGPLSNSPSLTDNVWKGATLGSQTGLANTTYPATRHSVKYNNHWGFVHSDNKLYFCDVVNGKGVLHYIKTTKTTDEGDTNDSSTYNALDLPFNYLPYAITNKGTTLIIAASQTTDTTLRQGDSKLFFWDTVSSSFSGNPVPIPDPLTTALMSQNGQIYGWSGNLQGGSRFWRYIGGETIETLFYQEEGHPPLQGAVEGYGNRVFWGTFTTDPVNSASVMAFGSKSDLFPRGVHNVARSTVTATSTNGLVSAIKNVLQDSSAFPQLVIAGTDGTNYNIDKKSTTYQTHVWRSEMFNIGKTFKIRRIRIPLAQAVAANMTITPKLYFDDESSSQTGTVINSTNYPDSERFITLSEENFSNNVQGDNNYFFELTFSGTALATVTLPIEYELEIDDGTMD